MNSFYTGNYDVHETTGCGKPDCQYCRLTKENDGRATELNLLQLGLVQKIKYETAEDYFANKKTA